LTLALLVYTFWPENVFASQRQKTRLDYLLERKDQLYENLRDLNFEYRAGKYPEEDFQVQRASAAKSKSLKRRSCSPKSSLAAGVTSRCHCHSKASRKGCHLERSAAESKDLRLLFGSSLKPRKK
jgi:hypothetical protein